MSIRHETISIEGTVLYCDGEDCGARGPQEAYENPDDVIRAAIKDGWSTDDALDLCPKCVAKAKKERA